MEQGVLPCLFVRLAAHVSNCCKSGICSVAERRGRAIDENSGVNQNNQRKPDSFISMRQFKNNSKKAWEYIRYKHWI